MGLTGHPRRPPPDINSEDQAELENQIQHVRRIFLNVQGKIREEDEEKIYDIALAIVAMKLGVEESIEAKRDKKEPMN